jgi:hypothetical protein
MRNRASRGSTTTGAGLRLACHCFNSARASAGAPCRMSRCAGPRSSPCPKPSSPRARKSGHAQRCHISDATSVDGRAGDCSRPPPGPFEPFAKSSSSCCGMAMQNGSMLVTPADVRTAARERRRSRYRAVRRGRTVAAGRGRTGRSRLRAGCRARRPLLVPGTARAHPRR